MKLTRRQALQAAGGLAACVALPLAAEAKTYVVETTTYPPEAFDEPLVRFDMPTSRIWRVEEGPPPGNQYGYRGTQTREWELDNWRLEFAEISPSPSPACRELQEQLDLNSWVIGATTGKAFIEQYTCRGHHELHNLEEICFEGYDQLRECGLIFDIRGVNFAWESEIMLDYGWRQLRNVTFDITRIGMGPQAGYKLPPGASALPENPTNRELFDCWLQLRWPRWEDYGELAKY